MKEKVAEDERKAKDEAKKKKSELDVFDQSWHDSRYCMTGNELSKTYVSYPTC